MALKLRKEMKKSSYYVWFLGAKEIRGLRGAEILMPAVENLIQREKHTEPQKVTLQVSQKGLKIVQNIVRETGSGKSGKPKLDTVKHLIPSDSVAFAHQREDVVVCMLLLLNPVTGWPLHVHAYRCDSLDTARLLHHQLQTLSERPDNQKRWREVEAKMLDGDVKDYGRQDSSLGSDAGASSARGSDSGEERLSGGLTTDFPPVRASILYDSVAAELRARLGSGGGSANRPSSQPLLLPPRDYDTVHRQRGNLQGIELRRCLNTNIVGRVAFNPVTTNANNVNGSATSSGIGSDHASPSPDSPPEIGGTFGTCDGNSTSDEEWNTDAAQSTMYLMPDASSELVLLRRNAHTDCSNSQQFLDASKSDRKDCARISNDIRYLERSRSLEKKQSRYTENPLNKYAKNFRELEEGYTPYRSGDLLRTEFETRKETLEKHFEKQQLTNQRMVRHNDNKLWNLDCEKPRYTFGEDYLGNQQQNYQDDLKKMRGEFYNFKLSGQQEKSFISQNYHDYSDENSKKKLAEIRQRSPSPMDKISSQNRFKDAREKFLLMEKERLEKKIEPLISTTRRDRDKMLINPKKKLNHYEIQSNINSRRYKSSEIIHPKPSPRKLVVSHHDLPQKRNLPGSSVVKYGLGEKYDQKRKSMYNLTEDEHRHISNELNRKNYMEYNGGLVAYNEEIYREADRAFHELPESDRYNGLEQQQYSKSSVDLGRREELKSNDVRFLKNHQGKNRHSYAEPTLRIEHHLQNNLSRKPFPEMIQRTNSSISSNGRVGIASIHPY